MLLFLCREVKRLIILAQNEHDADVFGFDPEEQNILGLEETVCHQEGRNFHGAKHDEHRRDHE